MSGKIKIDDKTGKVLSAELDVNYASQLARCEKDLADHQKKDATVRRTLALLGITSRPLKEADLKKIAAEKSALTLIKELEDFAISIGMAHIAWPDVPDDVRKAEKASREELFKEAAKKMASRMAELEKSIADMKKELDTLTQKKSNLLKDIESATDTAPRKAFDKKFDELYGTMRKLGETYSRKNFDIHAVHKYIKKK